MQTDQITEPPTNSEPPALTDAGADSIATELAQAIVTAAELADEAMQVLAELMRRRRESAAELANHLNSPAITQRFGGYFTVTGALHHFGIDQFADIVRVAAAARAPLAPADRQFLAAYLPPSESKE